ETAPRLCQCLPSSVYCHVPEPLTPVTATPFSPLPCPASSVVTATAPVPGSVGPVAEASVGAVFTARVAVSDVALNAVKPPVAPKPNRLAVPPSVPLVPSQAFACKLAIPLKPAAGTKRTSSRPDSNSAVPEETEPTFCQPEPPSSWYCQLPVPVRPV